MMREAFQKQVQQNLEKLAVKISENGKNEDDPEPTAFEISLDHPHKDHPSLSSKLQINYAADRGRYRQIPTRLSMLFIC